MRAAGGHPFLPHFEITFQCERRFSEHSKAGTPYPCVKLFQTCEECYSCIFCTLSLWNLTGGHSICSRM